MKFIDISMPLHASVVTWDNKEPFNRREIGTGEATVSKLAMGTHSGTHIDAPKHFLRGGKAIDKLELESLIGPCRVINTGSSIDLEKLRSLKIKKGERLLFKTSNSDKKLLTKKKFTTDYVSLGLKGALYLAKKNISLVGIDYLGIEKKAAMGHPVHKILLKKNVVIVEGLDLSNVRPGKYNFAVLPLRIVGADGAPARAVLWK